MAFFWAKWAIDENIWWAWLIAIVSFVIGGICGDGFDKQLKK